MRTFGLSILASGFLVDIAQAGVPAPLPAAGVTGPIGLLIAIAGYVGYRLIRARQRD